MSFAALDLHQQHIEAVVLNDDGSLVCRQRFPSTREAILAFAQHRLSPTGTALAVEATFNTWPIVDLLTPLVARLVVSNPLRTRAIAAAKIKTDKVDALVLAQLLRLDYLPLRLDPRSGHSTTAPRHHRARPTHARSHSP